MMNGCSNCYKIGGATLLVLGLAFLVKDLGYWRFFGVEWYTALFIVMGIGSIASANCPDCRAVRGEVKKK